LIIEPALSYTFEGEGLLAMPPYLFAERFEYVSVLIVYFSENIAAVEAFAFTIIDTETA
jgi:hypothetical protein